MEASRHHENASADWKSLPRKASIALAQSDIERLEELSVLCQGLVNSPISARDVREVKAEMAVLRRVLEATRANLDVMHRLLAIQGQTEYNEASARGRG